MFGLFLLAVALAMDAFAVALVRGSGGEHSLARALETGLAFGVAQGVMPLAGWALGGAVVARFAAWDHWIAFALLAFLGLRMLREASLPDEERADAPPAGKGHYAALALAAIATSIDAAAAGLTLDLFGVAIWLACVVIGLVTAALCVPAYWFAGRVSQRFGGRLGRRAEVFGGIVLIALGVRIVIEHTAAI